MARELLIDFEKCLGCRSCQLACATAHSRAGSLIGAVLGGEKPLSRIFVNQLEEKKIPLNCRHCEEAACVDACISGAMRLTGDGVVTNEGGEAPCTGCWMCVMVCQYGVIRGDRDKKRAVKCDRACLDPSGNPACVSSCPTGALKFETVDHHSSGKRYKYLKKSAIEFS